MSKSWNFKFRNLGPIKDAALEIGDLTIITGRNNTGKTYLVYTLYGFLRDFDSLLGFIAETWSDSDTFSHAIEYPSNDIANHLLKNKTLSLKASRNDLDKDRTYLAKELSGWYSNSYIDDVFNTPAGTFSNTRFEIEVESNKKNYSPVDFEDHVAGDMLVNFSNDSLSFFLEEKKAPNRRQRPRTHSFIQEYVLAYEIRLAYIHFLLQDNPLPKTYPRCSTSARLAISLFYPELETSRRYAIRRMQQDPETYEDEEGRLWISADTIERTTSRYALPINDEIDFIKGVPNSAPDIEHHNKDLLDDLEKIMGGILTKEDDIFFFTSSKDNLNQFKIPLHLASSSTLELCRPYFHFATEQDARSKFLVIDEPESHIDPVNQIKLARSLVRWVKSGIKILISTHSDFIVKEINNLIMLDSHFDDKEQLLEELRYKKEDSIHPSMVKAYYAVDGGLKPCHMNEYGIEVPSFEDSIDELIRTSSMLGSRIMMKGNKDE